MDGRGRSKPPTNLYSTRPPQNIFPTHTVNYLPHSHLETAMTPKPPPQPSLFSFDKSFLSHRIIHYKHCQTLLNHTHQQSLEALCKCSSWLCHRFVICFHSDLILCFMWERYLIFLHPFVIEQLQLLSLEESSLNWYWNLPWFISALTKPPTVDNPHEFS